MGVPRFSVQQRLCSLPSPERFVKDVQLIVLQVRIAHSQAFCSSGVRSDHLVEHPATANHAHVREVPQGHASNLQGMMQRCSSASNSSAGTDLKLS
ncbi:hypothetical protein [Deinococcus alpinitundrae]|uniref:hypothetical protein n=1 Tax=Deinococcus alpinitundrae TaxID=468913 RepID=UPI001ED94937|nr:hypothetical protein [Deinococcus alpinitundrae]